MPKTRRKRSPIDDFLALGDAERRAVTARFDQEFIAESATPLTPAQRKLWEKAKRKPGRPRVGAGSKKFLVSMERTLLSDLDRTAKSKGLTRSALLSAAARVVIAHPEKLRAIPRTPDRKRLRAAG